MDLPVADLLRSAEETRIKFGPENCHVLFKFTCAQCGARCTFGKPDTIFESGECHACHAVTKVEKGGYTLVFSAGTSDDLSRLLERLSEEIPPDA